MNVEYKEERKNVQSLAADIMAGVNVDHFRKAYDVYWNPSTGKYDDDLLDQLKAWFHGVEYNDLLVRLYAEMAVDTAGRILYNSSYRDILSPFNRSSLVNQLVK